MDILVSGLLLGGTYALVAMGLNLQYGVARIMNLASGEMLVLGALAAVYGCSVALAVAINMLLKKYVTVDEFEALAVVRRACGEAVEATGCSPSLWLALHRRTVNSPTSTCLPRLRLGVPP